MTFLQVIEMHTTRWEELQEADREWLQATEGKRTLRREIVVRDRKDPDRYLIFAFFDSYESAMENSNLPETGEIAAKMAALTDVAPSFEEFDVIDQW
jgi:hypothetical protein